MPAPFWNKEPEAWDILFVARDRATPMRAPGIVKECKVQRGIKLDEKSAPGANGATLTYQGKKLAKVEIKLTIWTEQDLIGLELLIAELMPGTAKGAPKPRDFISPRLAIHGLKSLYVEEIEGPEGPDDKGIASVTLKCIQFAPTPKAAKAVTATPKTGAASTATTYSKQVFSGQLREDGVPLAFARYDNVSPLLVPPPSAARPVP